MNRSHPALRILVPCLVVMGLLFQSRPPVVGAPSSQAEGQRPPALTPFAEDDPIPKLKLQAHAQNESPRQVAESFLANIAVGYGRTAGRNAGGTVFGGDREGYAKAWALMAPGANRPSLDQFQARWEATLRMGLIQLEPITPNLFFFELERVDWAEDHWAVSYWHGELGVVKTNDGWRVSSLQVCPESLSVPNIIGHTSWPHSEKVMAKIASGFTTDKPESLSRQYQRRTVTIRLRNVQTGEVKSVRMARVVEGAWKVLEPRGWPTCKERPD